MKTFLTTIPIDEHLFDFRDNSGTIYIQRQGFNDGMGGFDVSTIENANMHWEEMRNYIEFYRRAVKKFSELKVYL